MNAPCAEIRDLLPWFVGGDLAELRMAAVREHLQTCSDCRREASSLLRATRALRSLHPGCLQEQKAAATLAGDAVLGEMRSRILAAVGQEAARVERNAERALRLRPWLAVAAMFLLTLGCWIGIGRPSSVALQRRPLATPASSAQPATGPFPEGHVDWHLLGDETGGISGEGEAFLDDSFAEDGLFGADGFGADGFGAGHLGRDGLRPLLEDQFSRKFSVRLCQYR